MNADKVIEICELLNKAKIDVWLDGGWGVDALLGEQTRQHSDLDIVVQEKDVSNLRKILEEKGYPEIKRDDTSSWNFVLGDNANHLIDVHVVVFDSKGNGIYGPKERGVMYPSDSFNGKGIVNGFRVNCLTPEYQIISHSGYDLDEDDIKDVSLLRKKFNLN